MVSEDQFLDEVFDPVSGAGVRISRATSSQAYASRLIIHKISIFKVNGHDKPRQTSWRNRAGALKNRGYEFKAQGHARLFP